MNASESRDETQPLTPEQQRIDELQAELAKARWDYSQQRKALELAEKAADEHKAQYADLKQRLLAAETANQFMRGYLARVQEDDQVREELITTGDPTGEAMLVPKRKSTQFSRPSDFSEPQYGDMVAPYYSREKKSPKHWITY